MNNIKAGHSTSLGAIGNTDTPVVVYGINIVSGATASSQALSTDNLGSNIIIQVTGTSNASKYISFGDGIVLPSCYINDDGFGISVEVTYKQI